MAPAAETSSKHFSLDRKASKYSGSRLCLCSVGLGMRQGRVFMNRDGLAGNISDHRTVDSVLPVFEASARDAVPKANCGYVEQPTKLEVGQVHVLPA